MKQNHCDILDLEWNSNGRDAHIAEPVLVSLEERYGYRIVRSSIWSALFKLLWFRPRILVIANDIGAENICRAFHFANRLGIITVTMISEGNIRRGKNEEQERMLAEQFFWGDNFKREKYWDLKLLWSNELLNAFKKWIPWKYLDSVRVCGATGFDRYKLFNEDVEELRDRFGIKTDYVVLISGYGFDLLHRLIQEGNDPHGECAKIYAQKEAVRKIYKKLIEDNPSVTFIIKRHPGTLDKEDQELSGLETYPNTMVLQYEADISQLLRMADIVLCFDSTVAMEAWMLGKISVFVNPLGTDFDRSDFYKGAVVIENYSQLARVFDQYYERRRVSEFDALENKRQTIIEKKILAADGLNYLRSAKEINNYIRNHSDKKASVDRKLVIEMIKELAYEA